MIGEGNDGGPEHKTGTPRIIDSSSSVGEPTGETDEAARLRLDEEWDRAEEMAVQGINAARFRMDRRMRTRVAPLKRP